MGELFDNVLGRIYLRSAEEGFRNSATTSFRPGQTRWGAGINAGLGPDTRLRLQYDQESNYGVSPAVLTSANALLAPGQESVPGPRVDNTLRTINLGVEQRLGEAVLGFDWVNRSRSDRVRVYGYQRPPAGAPVCGTPGDESYLPGPDGN
jgi:hypothetical protein